MKKNTEKERKSSSHLLTCATLKVMSKLEEYKNANIANFVLAMLYEMKKTNKVYNFKIYSPYVH